MKQLVENWWKNGKSWRGGIIILTQIGYDQSIIDQIKATRNDYAMKLLEDAMNKVLECNSPIQKQEPEKPDEMPEDSNAVLQALRQEWLPKYTTMNLLRHKLDPLLDDDSDAAMIKRGKIALEILELEQECMTIWAKRDHYIKHGKLPMASDDQDDDLMPVVDPFKAANRIKNLKIYITRYNREIQKDPSNAKAAELLCKYQEELDKLQMAYETK